MGAGFLSRLTLALLGGLSLLACGEQASVRPDTADGNSTRPPERKLGTAASEAGSSKQHAAVSRPNVLLYISDTLRADGLARYGNATVETPVIDGLAREGMLFERAYAVSAWTRASIGSILGYLDLPALEDLPE